MGFEFSKQCLVEICGKQYPVDVSDPAFIDGVITDFTAISERYNAFVDMRASIASSDSVTAEQIKELSQRLVEENAAIAEHGREFIIKALGREAYDTIFAGRRPSAADHIELCAYIYREALAGREKVVTDSLNRSDRRAVQKAAKRPNGWRAFLSHKH